MGDGITLIDEPHIHTYYRCTCWHIRGGGIALREAASGVLISGDLIHDGPLIEDTYHSDAADYRWAPSSSDRRARTCPEKELPHGICHI